MLFIVIKNIKTVCVFKEVLEQFPGMLTVKIWNEKSVFNEKAGNPAGINVSEA